MGNEEQEDTCGTVRWGILVTGTLAALIGTFWLGAWLTGFAARWSAAGIITVKTNMALGQILAGLALLLLAQGSVGKWRRWAGAVLSVLLLLVGALILSEHLFGWNLGIDQLLAREALGATATDAPNRVGLPGSFSLTALGAGLLAVALGRSRVAPYLGMAVCLVNLVPAVGFLYGIDLFYLTSHLTHIAWPTVIALFSLGIGLMLAHTESGPMALLLRDNAGGALLRRILPAVVFVPLVLGFLSVMGQHEGLYNTATGTGFLVIALILVFSAMLWRSAAHLSRSDAAHREDEEALHSAAQFPEENPNPVLRIDLEGQVLYTNRAAEELLAQGGWKPGEAAPLLLSEPVDAALRSDEVGEFEMPPRDGRVVSFVCVPIAAKHYVNLYGRDITEHKQAEEALRESREDMQRAQEVGQIGSWRLDVRRNVLAWSDENYRIFGVPQGTPMTYEGFLGVIHPEDRPYVDAQWNAGLRGEPYDIEHRIVVGEQVEWVREKAYLEFDDAGELLGGFGITQVITERKQAQQREHELEARQRDFYRRTIRAATGGKLEIVEADAMPGFGGQTVRKWEFHTPDEHLCARQEAFALAEELGLAGDRLHDFMACVGETMSNALKHAGGGEATVARTDNGIVFAVSDTGSGIDSISLPEVALVDGYSTAGTGGLGYKLIIACADKVYLATGPDGTTVAVEMRLG